MKQIIVGLCVWLCAIPAQAAPGDVVGPSIGDELQAAGLAGLPFSWRPSDGTLGLNDPRLTAAQRTVILAVFAAHNPLTPSKADVKARAKKRAKEDFAESCRSLTLTPSEKTLCAVLSE